MDGTRRLGIHLRGGGNAALRDLLLTVPVAVLASFLALDDATLERHAAHAGTTWVSYTSYRTHPTRSNGSVHHQDTPTACEHKRPEGMRAGDAR
jgi:hypothetical protein